MRRLRRETSETLPSIEMTNRRRIAIAGNSERFAAGHRRDSLLPFFRCRHPMFWRGVSLKAMEVQIDDGCEIEGKRLGEDKSTNNGDTERTARVSAHAAA